ncbi:MAG: hypothetical protein K0R29_620 [Pseudobdellovibrio sp.]|jgi:hypothetical protein|nr:hypothetical protein [Pseudobdellovibrio sp.]
MNPENRNFRLFCVIFSFFSWGCDSVCKFHVADYAKIQNTTGRVLQLTFCKGRNGTDPATVPADSLNNEVDIGAHADMEIRGGPTSACDGVSDRREATVIGLTSASFGQVKLCRDQTGENNVIVEIFQTCPTGFSEQLLAEDCN